MASKSKQELGTKRVVLLIETLNRGGIENVLLRLLPKLKHAGWTSTVLTIKHGGEMLPEYQKAGIDVVTLHQNYFFSYGTLQTIKREVQKLNPDIVVTTLVKADFIGRFFLRFMLTQPVVPYLVTTYNHPRYWIARVFEWVSKPFATFYIANSDAVKKFYVDRLGVRAQKIEVAPNGVDTEVFQSADPAAIRRELKLPHDAFVVTCVANLAANKGQADLLDAFNRIFADNPKAFLLLVGDGQERQALLDQRETLASKDRIFLLGRRTDVPAILQATSVFALPTLFEGMSTAILEAMAAKRAIVTTDIPENKVLITHNETGLLFPPKDRGALADALETVYNDLTLRNTLANSAFDFVLQHYSLASMAEIFVKIFDQLAPSAGKPTSIIHFINSLETGGAETMLLKTLPLLSSQEHRHVVVTYFRAGELAPRFDEQGIRVINIGAKSMFDLVAVKRLRNELVKQNPGLVVTYLFHASVVGRLYLQSRLRVPVIPFLRSTYNYPRYASARLFERATKNLVPHYFANSEAVKDFYVKHLGVKSKKITVIHNGIDTTLYEHANGTDVMAELALPRDRQVVTCVANLAINKGHTYLLEAFESTAKDFPNTYLLIVGEGQERHALEKQIEHYLSKSRIKFLGRRSDVPQLLAITDVFVLPTSFEGLSNALLEAMAARCAIITTDIPENKVILKNNESSLLVPYQDVLALQNALKELLLHKPLRRSLGEHAHQFVKQKFALSHVAKELDGALQKYVRVE